MRRVAFLLLFIVLILVFPLPAHASKSYGFPSLSDTPRRPDVMGNQGKTVRRAPWVLTVAPGTFAYDIYFSHGCWSKTFPMSLGLYWQVSDICEFWPRSHFNHAAAEINKSWLITYEYDEDELGLLGGLAFPESSLKIVYSGDHGQSWTMLKSSVVNTETNTVAAITNKAGGYMVMAGFVGPNVYYNYRDKDVLGATSDGDAAANSPSLREHLLVAGSSLLKLLQ